MREPLTGGAEPAKARLLSDGDIEEMRLRAEIDALTHKDEEEEEEEEEEDDE